MQIKLVAVGMQNAHLLSKGTVVVYKTTKPAKNIAVCDVVELMPHAVMVRVVTRLVGEYKADEELIVGLGEVWLPLANDAMDVSTELSSRLYFMNV